MKNVILIIFGLFLSAIVRAEVKVGDVPPSYLGKNRSGQEVRLDEMGGKVVIATFWASWCPPCISEMTLLERMQRKVGKDKLEIVAINFKEDKRVYSKIKKSLKDLEITMTHDLRGKISRKYNVQSVPHMFIINKRGLVEHIHLGYGESMFPVLLEEINTLLNSN